MRGQWAASFSRAAPCSVAPAVTSSQQLTGRAKPLTQIQQHNVDGLVVVGGDGSQKGAAALSQMGIAVVGVASTIDNDLAGSDTTIGVDTALNVALEAIDRLKTNGVLTPAGIFSSK